MWSKSDANVRNREYFLFSICGCGPTGGRCQDVVKHELSHPLYYQPICKKSKYWLLCTVVIFLCEKKKTGMVALTECWNTIPVIFGVSGANLKMSNVKT